MNLYFLMVSDNLEVFIQLLRLKYVYIQRLRSIGENKKILKNCVYIYKKNLWASPRSLFYFCRPTHLHLDLGHEDGVCVRKNEIWDINTHTPPNINADRLLAVPIIFWVRRFFYFSIHPIHIYFNHFDNSIRTIW